MDLTGILAAILSALFMGTVGVFAKFAGLDAGIFTFFRLSLGAGFMLLFLLVTGQSDRIACRPSWPVLINGWMLAGLIIFYVEAMEYTTMANAVMLLYLAPPVAAVFAHYFFKERLTRRSVALIGLTLFGFAMMMEFKLELGDGSRNLQGFTFGLLSMCCYAAFILINRKIDARIHVSTRTLYQLFTGALVMLPVFLHQRPDLPPQVWPWLVGIGLIPGFLAILCAVIALSRLPTATFGTLAYFEPITVIVLGWVLFNETLSGLQLAGCVVISASGIATTWLSASHS